MIQNATLNGGWILMPDWQDTGFVLATKRFSENGVILSVLTPSHGRHLGLIRTKTLPLVGSFVNVKWHARLSEHLGTYTFEATKAFSAGFMEDRKRLSAISSICFILDETLPEREAVHEFYTELIYFLDKLSTENWQAEYVKLEALLLKTLGFGLDLSNCAGGGDKNNLAYVSPKTGRAVSMEKGKPYEDKLLPLPAFLWKEETANDKDLIDGFKLTGYFLSQHIKSLPIMRSKII